MSRIFLRITLLLAAAVSTSLVVVSLAGAQDTKKKDAGKQGAAKKADAEKKAAKAGPSTTAKPAAKAFYAKYDQWKAMLKKLGEIRSRYNTAKDGKDTEAIKKEWDDTIASGEKLLPGLRSAAIKAYEESPNQDRHLVRLLVALTGDALGQDQYEITRNVAEVLIKHDCPDRKVWDFAGAACFTLHEFEKATKYFKRAEEESVMSQKTQALQEKCAEYVELWKKEQEIRKKQKDKKLPIAKIITTKGEITVELFEDEAPNTVANFISLAESGFYNDLKFHRVLEGFMAQTGCPKGNGLGGPGYFIYDECKPDKYPNYRRHFRGSLSMAKADRPDSGGSQFFLTFRPTPNLNALHTCFGRITKGIEVLEKLQRINPEAPDPRIVPDKMLKVVIVRKRDHEYIVNKAK